MPVSKTAAPSHEERVRTRAHEIWVHEGHPHGRDLDHWRQAEAEIAAEAAPADKQQRAAKVTPAKTEEPKVAKAKRGEAAVKVEANVAGKKIAATQPKAAAGSAGRSRSGTRAAAE